MWPKDAHDPVLRRSRMPSFVQGVVIYMMSFLLCLHGSVNKHKRWAWVLMCGRGCLLDCSPSALLLQGG